MLLKKVKQLHLHSRHVNSLYSHTGYPMLFRINIKVHVCMNAEYC